MNDSLNNSSKANLARSVPPLVLRQPLGFG